MKVIAIIPAYNEGSRIGEAVRDAFSYVDDLVVVDDCSSDNSGDIAFEHGAHVLRHIVNRGQGAALQTGADYAFGHLGADIVVHFDGDGQMRGEDIPALVEHIKQGTTHVVLGSRFLGKVSNMPLSRKLTLKAALLFTRLISGIKITDPSCGFRAFSKDVAPQLRFRQDRMAHASEIHDLLKANKISFVSHPVEIRYTQETLQKGMSFFSGFIVLRDYFKNKFFDVL